MAAKVRWERGSWWLVVHANGRRSKKRFGPLKADKKRAERAAQELNHRLALGIAPVQPENTRAIPFDQFANEWFRKVILLPLERRIEGHVSPNTARSYEGHVRKHLIPFFQQKDLREMRVSDIQDFYDHCIEIGSPRSGRSIELSLVNLRQIIAHAVARELIPGNVVDQWKSVRGRRRANGLRPVAKEKILSSEELQKLLECIREHKPDYFPFVLFLADTGVRLGEGIALRWSDVDLDGGTARIERAFTIKGGIGPTKTRRERVVELSSRLRAVLKPQCPDIHPEDALVFPNEAGGVIDPANFRQRIFMPMVRKAIGKGPKRITPHSLRHTFVSLHMARGTNLKWIQERGGWTSAKMLLDVYGHFMPTESVGYADVLSAPDGTIRHQAQIGREASVSR